MGALRESIFRTTCQGSGLDNLQPGVFPAVKSGVKVMDIGDAAGPHEREGIAAASTGFAVEEIGRRRVKGGDPVIEVGGEQPLQRQH